MSYGQLCPRLDEKGLALHNLASLPHVSVVGACATATHGSGEKRQYIHGCVALEIVTADGEVVTLSRSKMARPVQPVRGCVGRLGVITGSHWMFSPPARSAIVYASRSRIWKTISMTFSRCVQRQPVHRLAEPPGQQVWLKHASTPGAFEFAPEFTARRSPHPLHPLADHSAENCTKQMGIPGPWYERLPHFRMNFTPSSGAELQAEYFVPRTRDLKPSSRSKTRDKVGPHLFISELRTIDADNLWMSTAYQRPSLAIHFTWKPEWPAVKQLLPMIEEELAPSMPVRTGQSFSPCNRRG